MNTLHGERWIRTKRPLDRALGVFVLVALAPVIALVALSVVVVDRHRPFVRLTRVGKDFEPFALLKFRTMTESGDGLQITASGDARVTRLGSIIRAVRIDEIPQLVNIVRGEMSLIGPRPESPEFVDRADEQWQVACRVRPGIGGPTQLFASKWETALLVGEDAERTYRDVVLPAKLDIDAWYVRHASLRLDARVLAATVRELFLRRSDDSLRRRVLDDVTSPAVGAVVAAVAAAVEHGHDEAR